MKDYEDRQKKPLFPLASPGGEKGKETDRNREYRLAAGFFVLIFLLMAGYLIYFQAALSEDFINSPYNTRQDSFADRVIRGDIVSSDSQLLAYTHVNEDGSSDRIYPYGNLFAHVVGFESNGKSGLEADANFLLLSSHEYFVTQMKNEFQGRKNQGDAIHTSLDTSLQSAAYYALGENRGAVIAMEPKTGRILAMVSKPDFDPNFMWQNWDYLVKDENDSSLLNRATNGAYPPGSTFKLVTALDYYRRYKSFEGYSYYCEGEVTVGTDSIHCYEYSVHGQEDFYQAFANSCNCAFAMIGTVLGPWSLRETAQDLLFNRNLPIASYRQSQFTLGSRSDTRMIMQTAIGQGDTLVSPMHLALITCAVANKGVLMKPSLIDEVVNASGDSVRAYHPEQAGVLMSQEEADALAGLMEAVVSYGTAVSLGWNGYTAAGKTGSAEYNEEGASHSWFIGYCDTEDPKLVVSVIVEGGGAGSQTAVPIAKQLFDTYYYG